MAIKELFQDSRPQVLLDPRASQRIDPRFKFTRSTTALRRSKSGFLETVPAGTPRYEYDANGTPLGLLIEPSRTNYLPYSKRLTTGWGGVYGGVVRTENFALAPDGTQTATRIRTSPVTDPGNASYSFGVYREIIGDFGTGVPITISVYVKPITLTSTYPSPPDQSTVTADLHLHVFTEGGGPSGWFNFRTKQISPNTSTTYGSVVDVGNGWYRVAFTKVTTSSDASNNHFLLLSNRTFGSFDPYPDGLEDFYVWGFQSEVGYGATSYIETPGNATVTRAADLLEIGSNLPSTGSIFIDARSLSSDVDDTLLSAANASDDKLTLAIRQPANLYNSKALVYEVDGAFKPTLPFPVPTDARERNLITYGANNYHYRSDSARYTPSSSTSVPAGMNRLGIGHDVTDPTKAFTGYINTVYLWPGEITPTVAEALVRGDVDPKDADAGVFTPGAGALAFVFNTQGTATDGNRVVELPVSGSTNNILVDWGDNTSSSFIGAAASVTVNHTYPAAGIYPVQITADSDGTNSGLQNLEFYNNSPADLVRVLQWGGTTTWKPTTMSRAFRDCTQLDFENAARTNLPDTSAITDWTEAFFGCSSISGTFPTFNTSAATAFDYTWLGCSSLTAFPFIDSSNVTRFNFTWQACSSLTSFPLIDTSSSTSFVLTWSGCSSLASFPLIDTSSATNLTYAWDACSSLTSFPSIDTSNVTSFDRTWSGCSGLTSFPLIDTSSATSFGAAWFGCSSLTSFPLLNSATVTNFGTAWFSCSSLTSFPLINTAAGTTFSSAWYSCSGLTSFPLINTAAGTSFSSAWQNCSSLTSFPLIDTSSGTNFFQAWRSCNGLTAFPALNFDAATGLASDASAVASGLREAWFGCSALATFPANLFDNTTCTRYLDAFTGCALTAASIENIIVSINAAGTSNGNLGLAGGTNAGASTWTANAVTAYNALVARGWTITRNA